MKKFFSDLMLMLTLIMIMCVFNQAHAYTIGNLIYVVQPSTLPVSGIGARALPRDIVSTSTGTVIKVKSIKVFQATTSTETITIYSNGFTSSTIKTVGAFPIPPAVGVYDILGTDVIPQINGYGDVDYINIPDMVIRASDPSGTIPTVEVIYAR